MLQGPADLLQSAATYFCCVMNRAATGLLAEGALGTWLMTAVCKVHFRPVDGVFGLRLVVLFWDVLEA